MVTKSLTGYQVEHRNNPTYAENQFYWAVRRHQGFDSEVWNTGEFKLQYKFGFFILDAVFPKLGLVVEIDGYSHLGREDYDAWRTAFIEACGLQVIRFVNEEVCASADDIVSSIFARPAWDGDWPSARRAAKDLASKMQKRKPSARRFEAVERPELVGNVFTVSRGRRDNVYGGRSRPRCPGCNRGLSQVWDTCHGCHATIYWVE